MKYLDCPACRNKGAVAGIGENGFVSLFRCSCMPKRRSLRSAAESGMSDLLDCCTFESYTARESWQEAAKAKAEAYLGDNIGKWFCALGSVGSGKTHLCVAICNKLVEQGLEVLYMPWRDKSTELKALVNFAEDYANLTNRYKYADVLYIDDFFKTGGARPSDADIKLAHEIINARYNDRNKVTLISSEWTVEQLLDFDEAVGSRIFQRSKDYTLTFTGRKNQRL